MFGDPPSASGIYAIRNSANGKLYVGSAVNLKKRRKEHLNQLRRAGHFNQHLQSAWLQYGETSFEFHVLELVQDAALLLTREQHHIDSANAADRRFGYNSRPLAHSNLGRKCSPETIERVRQSRIGSRHTEETRQKMSEARRGAVFSPEHGRKISKAKTGVPRPDVKAWAPQAFRRFSDDDVRELHKMRSIGLSVRAIARLCDCAPATVSYALRGKGLCYAGDQNL